jgi:hypothetical protein
VVCAHLERLIPAHHQPDLAGPLVLEQAHVARAALLPLEVGLGEAEELGAPGELATCGEAGWGLVVGLERVKWVGSLPWAVLDARL